LFKGVSMWHFHVHMHYNPNWFSSSIYLLSALVPFLWWFGQILKFYIYSFKPWVFKKMNKLA
jgi:hypothetical protein